MKNEALELIYKVKEFLDLNSENNKEKRSNFFIYTGLLCIAGAMFFALIYNLSVGIDSDETPIYAVIVFLCLGYLALGIDTLRQLWQLRNQIVKSFNYPAQTLLSNVEKNVELDHQFVCEIKEFSNTSKEYVAAQLMFEADATNGRVANLVGSLEKIGLFPGIVAAILTIKTVMDQSTNVFWMNIALAFACAYPFLLVYATLALYGARSLNRCSKLITKSID